MITKCCKFRFFQEMYLQGEFPSGVKYYGSMTRTIPKELCQWLPYLITLDLSQNQFTGSIPVKLHDCTYLNVLHPNGNNKLTGEIPWSLSWFERLEDFIVADNRLSITLGYVGFRLRTLLSRTCATSFNPMVVAAFLLFGIVLIVLVFDG